MSERRGELMAIYVLISVYMKITRERNLHDDTIASCLDILWIFADFFIHLIFDEKTTQVRSVESFSFSLDISTQNEFYTNPATFSLKVETLLSKVIKLKLTLQYRWTNKTKQPENLIMNVVEP